MPHRRKMEKGSFRDHLDGLVIHFPHDREKRESAKADERRKDKRHINDLLFDHASRD